jgi:hypothetical protein
MVLCPLRDQFRDPLRAHFVCGPLRLRAVVLYALASSVFICAATPWSSTRSPRSLVLCALTPLRAYPVCGPLRAHPSTRSPRRWSSACPARCPLRAVRGPLTPVVLSPRWSSHPCGPQRDVRGPLRAHPVVLYALTPAWWSFARASSGPLCAHPVVLYALTLPVVLSARRVVLYAPSPWSSARPARGPPRAVRGPLTRVVLGALTPWSSTRSPSL